VLRMASSISLRLCRNIVRRFVASRCLVVGSKYSISNFSLEVDRNQLRSLGQFVQPGGVCGLHTSAVNWKKKSTKRKTAAKEEESDAEEEEDEEEEAEEVDLARDFRMVDINVNTLRLDAVAKAGLAVPRGSVEQLLLEGKIRIDGQLCRKKALDVHVGMMIDLLLEPSPDNPDFSLIRRIIIHKISDRLDSHGRITVTVKKWASLTVDDYKITSTAKLTE